MRIRAYLETYQFPTLKAKDTFANSSLGKSIRQDLIALERFALALDVIITRLGDPGYSKL